MSAKILKADTNCCDACTNKLCTMRNCSCEAKTVAPKVIKPTEVSPRAKYVQVLAPGGMRYEFDAPGILQLEPSAASMRILREAGLDVLAPAASKVGITWTEEVYVALTEQVLSWARTDPETGGWMLVPPTTFRVVRGGTPANPPLGPTNALLGEQARWWLMGAGYTKAPRSP